MSDHPCSHYTPLMIAESNSHESRRYEKYKQRLNEASTMLVKSILHLVRPTEGFPTYTHNQIKVVYDDWCAEERSFNAAVREGVSPTRVWPKPPATSTAACWRMWGIQIQKQVEGVYTAGYNLPAAVSDILATPECASHDSNCPCKIPDNTWTFHEHVKAIEPLGVKHAEKCECSGFMRCAKMPLPPARDIAHSDICSCGRCYQKRVDNGTVGEYMKKLQADTDAVIAKYYNKNAEKSPEEDVKYIKKLFKTVQGVNFDDKCPHDLPYYACMDCSH